MAVMSYRFVPGDLPLSKESAIRVQELLPDRKHEAELVEMHEYYGLAAKQLLERMRSGQPLIQVPPSAHIVMAHALM
jgi:hypothetical protein